MRFMGRSMPERVIRMSGNLRGNRGEGSSSPEHIVVVTLDESERTFGEDPGLDAVRLPGQQHLVERPNAALKIHIGQRLFLVMDADIFARIEDDVRNRQVECCRAGVRS